MQRDLILFMIVFTVVSIALAAFLWISAGFMIHMRSYERDVAEYYKTRRSLPTYKRAFLNVLMAIIGPNVEWSVKIFGNDFLTMWYRVSGYIFSFISVAFVVGLVTVWLGLLGVFE